MLKLSAHGIDGLEGIVLKEFLADLIPEIFLWIELWRVARSVTAANHDTSGPMSEHVMVNEAS